MRKEDWWYGSWQECSLAPPVAGPGNPLYHVAPKPPRNSAPGSLDPISREPLTFRSSSQILCQLRQDLNLGSGKNSLPRKVPSGLDMLWFYIRLAHNEAGYDTQPEENSPGKGWGGNRYLSCMGITSRPQLLDDIWLICHCIWRELMGFDGYLEPAFSIPLWESYRLKQTLTYNKSVLCTLVERSDLIGLTVLKFGLNSEQWRGPAYQEGQAAAGGMTKTCLSEPRTASSRGAATQNLSIPLPGFIFFPGLIWVWNYLVYVFAVHHSSAGDLQSPCNPSFFQEARSTVDAQ